MHAAVRPAAAALRRAVTVHKSGVRIDAAMKWRSGVGLLAAQRNQAQSRETERKVGRPRADESRRGKDPRHEIMVAAAHLFSVHGYEGTQLNQIAAAAGLRTPSIYYYFAGKEEIRRALSAYAVDQSAAFATDMLTEGGRAAVKLHRLLVAHIGRLTSGPYDLWFLIELPGPLRSQPAPIEAMYSAWRRSVVALVEKSVEAGDFRPIGLKFALHMIIGCVHGAMELRHINRPAAPEQIADFIVRALAADGAAAEDIQRAARSTVTFNQP